MKRRRRKKQRRLIIISSLTLLFIMTVGYAAFQTNLNISVKGNIKDIKKEIDSKVPMNDLLFWGQADNSNNTLSLLKDKSGKNNDGILNGFNNTAVSGYNNGELVFDGVDDYVDLGFVNYDFNNSQSFVLYIKINKAPNPAYYILGNWEGAGGGLFYYNGYFTYESFDGTSYISTGFVNNFLPIINTYYTITGTYDGNTEKLYIDAELNGSASLSKLTPSPAPVAIGVNPDSNGMHDAWSKISLKEIMLYDRALTENEVKTITEGFEKKYH